MLSVQEKKMKKIIGVTIIIMLLSSVVFAMEERFDVGIGNSPQLGPKDALIAMIEFIDFQ